MRIALCLPLLLVAACNDGPGANITFDTTSKSGNGVKARADGNTGRVSIDAPGFKADVSLPKISFNADKMDISGVKLFPGSSVTGMSVFADDSKADDQGKVRIAFDAPGGVAAVRDWFGKEMTKHGFTVKADGAGLAGATDEGGPFKLELAPGAGGRTTGTLIMEGKN